MAKARSIQLPLNDDRGSHKAEIVGLTSALIDRGMLTAKSHRAPLRLAFQASAAERWLPRFYPADASGGAA
jgi:hypothetical protein